MSENLGVTRNSPADVTGERYRLNHAIVTFARLICKSRRFRRIVTFLIIAP